MPKMTISEQATTALALAGFKRFEMNRHIFWARSLADVHTYVCAALDMNTLMTRQYGNIYEIGQVVGTPFLPVTEQDTIIFTGED